MSDSSNFIAQIQEQEKKSLETLQKTEAENNERITEAKRESDELIASTEAQAKEEAMAKLQSAKDNAKDEYKKMLVDGDNVRRNVVETGKTNLQKGITTVMNAFGDFFK